MTADAAGFHIDLARDDLDDIDEREAPMIDIKLPLRLVSVSNLREHWQAKAKRAKSHRGFAKAMIYVETVRQGRLNYQCSNRIDVTLTRVAPRKLDDDNLAGAFKAIRDGVADALNLPDDRDPRVTWLYAQERGKPGEYAVRVKIEAKGEAA